MSANITKNTVNNVKHAAKNRNLFFDRVVFILYVSMFLCVFFTVIGLLIYNETSVDKSTRIADMKSEAITDVIFYDANTDQVVSDIADLIHYSDPDRNGSVYTIIPGDLPENMMLCFKSRHTIVSISVNDKILYETTYADSNFYTNSIGTVWVTVPLDQSCRNQKLIVDFYLPYNDTNCGLSDISYMRGDGFILDIFQQRFQQLFISCAYMIFGFILITIGLIASRVVKSKDMSLFWLGALALATALYCFFETQMLQLFFENIKLIHLCCLLSMALIPAPAMAYAQTFLNIKTKLLPLIFTTVDFVVFITMMILNYFDIVDYRDCLPILQLFIVLAMIILAICIMRYIILNIRKQHKFNVYTIAMILGLLSITITGFVDIGRQIFEANNNDAAMYARFGFFGFFVCFAIASSERVIHAFQLSARAKFMAKLAYEDGLTGLKNRTSYKEKIADIEESKTLTGVIMMDLNNLKYVNDTFGHDDGDAMIISTADLIRSVFDFSGSYCYRIGGDEFVVLVQTEDPTYTCNNCMDALSKAYREFNANTEEHFKIVIAMGFSLYNPAENDRPLKDVIDEADTFMYIDKRELKKLKRLDIML